MKRIILTLCALLTTIIITAGTIDITSGSKKFLKSKGTICVTFNWDNAHWANGETLQQRWDKEYNMHIEEGAATFIKGFNEENKKLKAVTNADNADYTMTIDVQKIDYFFSATSIVPGHKHDIWAKVTVRDKAGNTVCEITIERMKGSRDFVVYDSYIKMMRKLGNELPSL